eukprot:GGOE01013992.1.p1 GENE.GGOE01013992.1~~GGOE01013992.1.p1  ORF type:complete len:131 (+),score=29.37 GGOE01013992.1:57-449(+)
MNCSKGTECSGGESSPAPTLDRSTVGSIWCALVGWTCLATAMLYAFYGVVALLSCKNRWTLRLCIPLSILATFGAVFALFSSWMPALLIGIVYYFMMVTLDDCALFWFVLVFVLCTIWSSLGRVNTLYSI